MMTLNPLIGLRLHRPFRYRGGLALLLLFVCLLPSASHAEPAGQSREPTSPDQGAETQGIPLSELGAKATADYQGDAIGVEATQEGAGLRVGLQKLAATVTRQGLQLDSTEEGAGSLRLQARTFGREGKLEPLSVTGEVRMGAGKVAWVRPGLSEEFSVSVDGVRQDFVVGRAPAGGDGPLLVELALGGARAEAAPEGAKLTLDGSGRELAYAKLHVTDAAGSVLEARIEVAAPDRLRIVVHDQDAVYPVRIDPTFSDADWVSLNPSLPGANGYIEAFAFDAAGNLYAGGGFTLIGATSAKSIAKWNGSAWSALGSGVSGSVFSLAFDSSGNLYAGGSFTSAGDVPSTRYIAKWNGSAWSALGSGMNSMVQSLAFDSSGNLYAGGYFTLAGGVPVNYIAKWNGSAWSALGSGVDDWVYSVACDSSGNLYAGGSFTSAGGKAANYIAKWNGSSWSALGSGMEDKVYSLVCDSSGNLYAGGLFRSAGGVSTWYIAKWNGSAWSALGSGMNGWVYSLACDSSGNLYAGGNFLDAGDVRYANRIAKWNGSAWSALGSGVSGNVYSLACDSSGNLYAGGSFTSAGGVPANYLAEWNGNAWNPLGLGSGVSDKVYSLAFDSSGTLYAGGAFASAGGVYVSNIAKWNGSAWSALGSGVNSNVRSLAFDSSGNLYAAVDFTYAGGAAKQIAKWNGSAWSALGSGVSGNVTSLACDSSGNLYAGGAFTSVGGVSANYIAKWNGSAWSALGSGVSGNVSSLAFDSSGNLYAGGSFTSAGGVPAASIAKWNGSAWSALGSGVSGNVSSLAFDSSGNLYVGGYFTLAGGVPVNYIAKWNGSAWSALGSGVDGLVRSLAFDSSGNLYAGGDFTNAGGVPANYIAKWNGSAWSALGSGMNSSVMSLACDSSGKLYAGGDFTTAGQTFSPYIAMATLNNVPVANAQSVTTSEDTAQTITLSGSDVEGSALTYTIVANPAHGTLSGTGANRVYTPAANYNGSDSFTFKVNDGELDSAEATVSITVTAVNDAPIANAQSVTATEDTAKAITLSGSDAEGSALTYTIVTNPAHGTLSGNGASRVYTPAANYNGSDSFTFRVNDGVLNSATATVTITVTAVNDAPIANAQSVTATEDTAKAITLSGSDAEGSALSYTIVTNPTHGTLSGTGANRVYTPAANYNGSDSFTFRVNDGALNSATATVTITVTAVNDAPMAVDDFSRTSGEPVTIAVLANDVDPEGEALIVVAVTQGSAGAVSYTGGDVSYTPMNLVAEDRFTYTVSDENGAFATAVVVVRAAVPVEVNGVTAGPKGAGDPVPGEATGTRLLSVGYPSIRSDGHLAYQALLQVGKVAQKVIISGNDGRVLVRQGDAAPDADGNPMAGVAFAGFSDPLNNDLGHTAFVGTLAGTGVSAKKNGTGLWTNAFGNMALVARTGYPAPEVPGALLQTIQSVVLSDNGSDKAMLAFAGSLATGSMEQVGKSNASALWIISGEAPELVLRAGDYLNVGGQSLQVRSFTALGLVSGSPGHGRASSGQAVVAKVDFSNGLEAVFYLTEGHGIELAALEGDMLEAVPGAKIASFGIPDLSSDGVIGGRVRLLPGTGGVTTADMDVILLGDAESDYAALLARQGGEVRDAHGGLLSGMAFKELGEPVINGQGRAAFTATVMGAGVAKKNDMGIWYGRPGELQMIAREGDPAPGTAGTFASFGSIALPDDASADGAVGPVFVASLAGIESKAALYAVDSSGEVQLLVRVGEKVRFGEIEKTVKSLDVLPAVIGSYGQPRSYNRKRDIAYRLTFTDKTQRIVTVKMP